MIIEGLLSLIQKLFGVLLSPINIPPLPDSIHSVLDTLFSYMLDGAALLGAYTHLSYLLVLFGIVLAVDAALLIYKIVMWILKKIPMGGIS